MLEENEVQSLSAELQRHAGNMAIVRLVAETDMPSWVDRLSWSQTLAVKEILA